ncbi:nucleotidyltransferase family protein [Carboxylicivirga sp. RSCT41]|uniref:nucleotidyltransferase family protein n=1 Tax=Carboxylicivirga agarovorans TaxID=3417570 RepID=UPI003D342803
MSKHIAKQVEQLIKLVALRQETYKVEEAIDSEFINFCNDNGLGAWCYAQHQKNSISGLDKVSLSNWKAIYFQNTIKYQRYLAVYNKVKQHLTGAGIPVMALKGIALASHLYGDDGLRPMGDIDILVPEGKGMEALDVLMKAGAVQLVVPRSPYHEQADAHVRAVNIDGIMLEIHQRLFSLGSSFHTPGIDFFNYTIEIEKQGVSMRQLNPLWMAYHLIAHAVKGIEMGGLRIGWLLDIALLIDQQKDHGGFVDQVMHIMPKKKDAMQSVVDMAMLLLPDKDQYGLLNHSKLYKDISYLLDSNDHAKLYRFINLRQLSRVPGLSNKLMLLFYEFFPSKQYMRYRYHVRANESLWRLYLKRIIRH